MNRAELERRLALATDLPRTKVHDLVDALGAVITEELARGEEVVLPHVGTLGTVIRGPRALRSIADHRRVYLGERAIVRFRPSAEIRRAAASRIPQHWRDPRHQAAWRLAETLIGDLALYHGARAPKLTADAADVDVRETCARAFGSTWSQATEAWERDVTVEVRGQRDYLAASARTRFGA